jgi:hypothetical protein
VINPAIITDEDQRDLPLLVMHNALTDALKAMHSSNRLWLTVFLKASAARSHA